MTTPATVEPADWRTERDRALLALERATRRDERVEAAGMLVQLALDDGARAPELSASIPRLLADKDDRVRRVGVALAAAVLPVEEAESFLGARLHDESFEVRVEATGQLADLARPSTRGFLAAALQDDAFAIRFEAARGMAALKHSAGLEILMEGLQKDHFRFRALGALAELGDVKALPAIQRIFARWLLPGFERTQAAGAMAKLGDAEGAKWLLQRTRKRRGMDRALAVELLGELRAQGAKERLLEVLRDPKDTERGAAARGLGRLGDPDAIEALASVLNDPKISDHIRADAAEGLCLLSRPEARAKVEAAALQGGPLGSELQVILQEYA